MSAPSTVATPDMLAELGHELRNQLGAVLGLATLLGESQLEPGQRNLVECLQRSARHTLAIAEGLLGGNVASEDTSCDPVELVEDVACLYKERAGRLGLELSCVLPGTLPRWLPLDGNRIHQILVNLLDNALKHTRRGSVVVLAEVHEGVEGARRFSVEVRDTGSGIPPEEWARVFLPFARVLPPDGRDPGGTGLGLTISRRLAASMGGRLDVAASSTEGTTFRLDLPLPEATPVPDALPPARGPRPLLLPREGAPGGLSSDAHERRVLLVEDDPVNRRVALRFLEKSGVRADAAESGHEALEATRARSYALILMDCGLPDMSGMDAARRILLQDGATAPPIVALTAHEPSAVREACLSAGMVEVLGKPISAEDLRPVLERWVPASPGAGSGVKDLDWSALRRIQDLWGEQGLAFLRELVGIYLKDAPVRVARLDEALTSRDRVALHDAAHAFKSSNASLGLRVLASLCVEIEEGAGHLPWDALSRLVAGVPGAFARARAALTAATGEPPLAESGPPL